MTSPPGRDGQRSISERKIMTNNYNPVTVEYGTCNDCGRVLRLNGHGCVYRHKTPAGEYCWGSGSAPRTGPLPAPVERERCLIVTAGRAGCCCTTCWRELAGLEKRSSAKGRS
jgi:hypothetical protein